MIIAKRNKELKRDGKEVEEEGVTVTLSKIIGFIVILAASIALYFIANSTVSILACSYALLSMLEF